MASFNVCYTPWITQKNLIVAGAGPASLSLALSIHNQWKFRSLPVSALPRITILERDSRDVRLGPREGYTLSLRTDGGQGGGVRVLDDLGLYEAVKARSVGGGEAVGDMVFWRAQQRGSVGECEWNEVLRMEHSRMSRMHGSRPGLGHLRAKRNVLQSVLAEAVEKLERVEILWEREVVRIEQYPLHQEVNAGKVKVMTKQGEEFLADLLVAADGSKSKIRQSIRPDLGLDFTGIVMITGTARYARAEDVPEPFTCDWGLVLNDNGAGVFLAPVDEKSVVWSVSYHSTTMVDELRAPFSPKQAEELLTRAKELGSAAGGRLVSIIGATDTSTLMRFNARDRPPFKHDLAKHGLVLFIGDANHAVSPFAGNGANMALLDGWSLAKCLCESEESEEAVRKYEEEFVPRTETVLKQSHQNIDVGHAKGWWLEFYVVVLRFANLVLKWT